jgi:acid phosphatase type 7
MNALLRCSGLEGGRSAAAAVRGCAGAALGAVLLCCALVRAAQPEAPASPAGMLSVAEADLHTPLSFIVYGDMRFTDPKETDASRPGPRLALVQKIATEPADALILTGDVPWHGGEPQDYQEFAQETAAWREQHLRVYPVLGNHEFQRCEEAACLAAWWQAFPELAGRRWYTLALGSHVLIVGLDSNTSLLPGSPQRSWLEQQLQALPPQVRFVMLFLHHPPVADEGFLLVRPNERSLTALLAPLAARSGARFIVVSGHIHNYERFERDGVVYVVSGGGGARPHPVIRGSADLYRAHLTPNFHYLRFTLGDGRLSAQMVRLEDSRAPSPHVWAVRDSFEVTARTP